MKIVSKGAKADIYLDTGQWITSAKNSWAASETIASW
jgi:hypothetical protein